jgi:hypothetical protein
LKWSAYAWPMPLNSWEDTARTPMVEHRFHDWQGHDFLRAAQVGLPGTLVNRVQSIRADAAAPNPIAAEVTEPHNSHLRLVSTVIAASAIAI